MVGYFFGSAMRLVTAMVQQVLKWMGEDFAVGKVLGFQIVVGEFFGTRHEHWWHKGWMGIFGFVVGKYLGVHGFVVGRFLACGRDIYRKHLIQMILKWSQIQVGQGLAVFFMVGWFFGKYFVVETFIGEKGLEMNRKKFIVGYFIGENFVVE